VTEPAGGGAREAIEETRFFIGGGWLPPRSAEPPLVVVDPATEDVVGRVPTAGTEDVDAAVAAARRAFDESDWPRLSPQERAGHLTAFADALASERTELTELLRAETGFPRAQARFEAGNMVALLRHAARMAPDLVLREERSGVRGAPTEITHLPVGVIAAIPAWNSPQTLAGNKIAPALLAGCTVVLKPAEQTSLDAFVIARAAERSGLPAGVLNVITGDASTAAALVAHPGVDKVAFTGSTAVGARVAAAAAANITRLSLELGGKSAAIVCDDAALDQLLATLLPAVLSVNGEMCVAISRLLVSRARKAEVVAALRTAMERVVVGDPADDATQLGPLVTRQHRDRVLAAVRAAVAEGATLVTGGGIPDGLEQGFYLQPTIVTDVDPRSSIAQEELFAPVLVVLEYEDLDDAVRMANDTPFGLSGAVYSADPAQALELARRIRSGSVHVNNGMNLDFDLPFGGLKASGYGREYGREGVFEYLEPQVVYLDRAAR
jgi:acyl-CoA reductase-like NAD-dependent aldehyde dehydrogenase